MLPRPKGVFVVSIFLLAGAAIAFVTAVSLLWPGSFLDGLWKLNPTAYTQFSSFGEIAGILLLAAGIITCAAGVGLVRRRNWGLWLAVAIFCVNVAGDTINIFVGEPLKGLGGLLVAGGFLFYLLRPRVRSDFR